jgi:hypothetical protein
VATFTITTPVSIDSLTGKTGGDVYNINGGFLTVDQDSRYGLNNSTSATMLTVACSASLGGSVQYKGDKVRLIPYDTGAGLVPASNTVISQGGASGLLIGVYSALDVAPSASGGAMPASGFIKVKQWNDVAYASGALTGISANATGPDVVGWIEVVGEELGTITLNRLNNTSARVAQGAWYTVGTTDGVRATTYQIPSNGRNQYHGGVFVQSGAAVSPSAASWSGGITTFTATAHGLIDGQAIVVEGSSPVAYNSPTKDFVTVVDANTFTVPYTADPGTFVSASIVPIEFYPTTSDSALSTTVATSERKGKVCWISVAGLLRFGHDGTNSSGGYVPPTGRKIYMGNVFMQSATAAARTQNSFNAALASRFRFVTLAAGLVDIDRVSCAWNLLSLTNCSQLSLTNSSFINRIAIANNANSLTMTNVGMGQLQVEGSSPLTFSACLEGGTLTNLWIGRGQWSGSNNYGIVFSNSTDFDGKNIYVYGTSNQTSSQYPLYLTGCNRIFLDGGAYNGRIWLNTVIDVEIKNFRWWQSAFQSNSAVGDNLVLAQSATNVLLENIDVADGDMPPTIAFSITTNCINVKTRNMGTITTPITTGLPAFVNATTTRVTTTATVTTSSAHGLVTGQNVFVWQTDMSGITNGAKVITVTSATTFTFVCLNSGAASGEVSYVPTQQTSIATITNSQNIKFQNIHAHGTRSIIYTANNTNKDVYIENVTASDNPLLSAGVAGATNLRLDSVTTTQSYPGVQSAVYGSHFVSGFQHNLSGVTLNGVGVSWTRVTSTITVTATAHGLITGAIIEILDSSAPATTVSGRTRTITVTGKNTFTYTGANVGAASGTLDFIVSDSRLTLQMNEPNADTSPLFTVNSGTPLFTGAGNWSALAAGDQATWEQERFILGFTGIPNMLPWWTLGGGNEINYRLQYDIDRGSGFSGTYKNWFYPEGGGSVTSGSAICNVTSTTNIAVGDFVNGQGIPNNTKVLTVDSPTQLTLDTNANATIAGQTLIFNQAPNETAFPSTGVKFRLRITLLAVSTQPVSFVYMPLTSDATSRARLYPQDVETVSFTLSGLPTGTTVALYDNTDTELQREDNILTGEFQYNYIHSGSDITDVYYVVWHEDYVPFKSDPFDLTATDLGLSYTPIDDPIYDAAHDDRYTIDFATKRIIMDTGETQYDVPGAYSHWKDQIFLADNFTYDFAFQILGGVAYATPKAIPPFTALLNSWKIRPDETNHTLTVENGILYVEGGGDPFVNTLGAYTVRINYSQPVEVLLVSTGSGVLPSDITDIVDAVWDEAISGHQTSGTTGRILKDGADNAELSAIT